MQLPGLPRAGGRAEVLSVTFTLFFVFISRSSNDDSIRSEKSEP